MNEKHQFIIPAVILVAVVGVVAAYGFIQAQTAWLRPASQGQPSLSTDGRAEIAGGAILNTGGATNGLIVSSGNVGIGTMDPAGYRLNVNGQIKANDLIGSGNLRIAGSGNDKHVAILGGGGSSPSANEGAAIYARGRWDPAGSGIFQVFTPNTSAVAVERFRIESGDDPDVRIMNSFLNISEVTSFLSSTCDTLSEYGRLAYKNEQSTIPSIGATIKSWELSLCTEYDGWEHVSSKCTCLSGCSSCSIISP